jgi:hypothetical protein
MKIDKKISIESHDFFVKKKLLADESIILNDQDFDLYPILNIAHAKEEANLIIYKKSTWISLPIVWLFFATGMILGALILIMFLKFF